MILVFYNDPKKVIPWQWSIEAPVSYTFACFLISGGSVVFCFKKNYLHVKVTIQYKKHRKILLHLFFQYLTPPLCTNPYPSTNSSQVHRWKVPLRKKMRRKIKRNNKGEEVFTIFHTIIIKKVIYIQMFGHMFFFLSTL